MLRNLIAKVLKAVLKAVEPKKVIVSVEDFVTVTSTESKAKGVKVHETHEVKVTDVTKLERDEKKAFIDGCLEDITAELYVKGYKAIPEILEQYHVEVVQAFVLGQLVQLGQYDPEHDNLDQYTMAQLIDMASQNNQLLWRQRQIEQGNAQCSEKQIELIKSLSKQLKVQVVTPKDKFEASEIIESLNKRLGKTTGDNKPSSAQINAINSMRRKLGKELAIAKVAVDVKSASSLIAELQNELNAKPELNTPNLASASQIDFVKRLLVMQKKRWTAKREEQYKAMTSKEISEVISTLKAECEAQGLIDNKASEGQVRYILSLGKLLKKNYSPEEVKNIDKVQASKLIETLQREYLYFLYRGNGNKITKKEISAMTLATVRQLIEQLQLERKTNLYESSADGYSTAQQCL
jgi:hypothetical protein